MSRDSQESESTTAEEEAASSSGEEKSSTESDEESEEELEEPVLKYKRFAKNGILGIDHQNIICCVAVHPKFIALGTGDGTIKLLDHAGTTLKDCTYTFHSARINQISLDDEGEFLASCSDDGKVCIVGLFTTKYNNSVTFDRMVNSVALHPHFSKRTNHMFVVGTNWLVMIEERRWPMGNKTMELHGGYGPITTIKWKENLIAWANDKMVLVYDTTLRERIASISFEEESPTYLPCSLYWQNYTTLLVGRGHFVKMVALKEGEVYDPQEFCLEEMVAPSGRRCTVIVSQNVFPEFLVCGVVPIFDDQKDLKLVVLCYDAKIDPNQAIRRCTVPPPHLIVVPPGRYLPNDRIFEVPEHSAYDKLLSKGYICCRSDEYHLECVLGEDRFYIVSPIDILLAEKRDANDHIDWLLRQGKFEEAMKFVENPQVVKVLHPGKLQELVRVQACRDATQLITEIEQLRREKAELVRELQSQKLMLAEKNDLLKAAQDDQLQLRQQVDQITQSSQGEKEEWRQQTYEKDRIIQNLQSEKEALRRQISLGGRIQSQQTNHSEFWEVSREEISLNMQKFLGTGAWGFVVEGTFRGQQVAVKCMHDMIRSPKFVELMRKEIAIMAQVRHPNLVLLIAAVLDIENDPLIVTELLDISLRKAYEKKRLQGSSKLSILRDIAAALNYLHLHQSGEIIHRDVSSANVLLEAKPNNQWKAKLSDFGSAKLAIEAKTTAPGAPVYSAPEVRKEMAIRQTAKVDVYSYGILLCEVIVEQFPDEESLPSMMKEVQSKWAFMRRLITACVQHRPDRRPTMSYILSEFNKLRSQK